MSNQTALTNAEVLTIAEDMGIKYERKDRRWEYWSIQGYEIVRNYQTGEYVIFFQNNKVLDGRGGMIDALRNFITAES